MTGDQAPLLAAIVLAGGKSSRMGQDKALIPVQGVPLLRRVCEVALQCTPWVYIVTPRIETYQPMVPATCDFIRESCLPGTTETQGPLIGFAQGLAVVQAEWVLLLACDLPCLTPQILQQWIAELPQMTSSDAPIALLPKSAKGWEPLCGFYRTACLARLQAAVDRGERSFQRWLMQENVRELSLPTPDILFNCNTPNDLQTLLKNLPG